MFEIVNMRRNSVRNSDIWVNADDYIRDHNIKTEFTRNLEDVLSKYDFPEIKNEDMLSYIRDYLAIPAIDKLTKKPVLIVDKIFKRIKPELLSDYAIDCVIIADKNVCEKIISTKFVNNIKLNELSSASSFITSLLSKAVKIGASDVYLSWQKTNVLIRYRIDDYIDQDNDDFINQKYADSIRIALINMSGENEFSSRPIDGKIVLTIAGTSKEFRLSIGKTELGFAIVIRSYKDTSFDYTLERLGYSEKAIGMIDRIMNNRYGMFLVTGSTGSGKTTGIYTILNQMRRERNIMIKTVEDPVEMVFEGIDQFQINKKGEAEYHFTYTDAVRMFLRQKPDVMMIGEIRDFEVAEEVVRAALTGHMVVSTLHTSNVETTITRLFDLGITKDKLEDSMVGIMNQRLVPTLCEHCKAKADDNGHFKKNPDGCDHCSKSATRGYKGVTLVCEIAEMEIGYENFVHKNFKNYLSYEESFAELYDAGIIDTNTVNYYK